MAHRLDRALCALGATVGLTACSSSWMANHPAAHGVPPGGGGYAVVDEAVHEAVVAGSDGYGWHDCTAECPTGLTCDEQTGECVRPPIAPPKGGPRPQ